MSRMSRNCRSRVQRLRGWGDDTRLPSGSRGRAPGILRSLLPPCCSNPRRVFVSLSYWWRANAVRLCECMPGLVSIVKSSGALNQSDNLAKIAAFFVKASSHCATSHYHFYRSNGLEAATGTHPPFYFHGPP